MVNYVPGWAVVLEGGKGCNFKTSPFLGVNFSLARNTRGAQILTFEE